MAQSDDIVAELKSQVELAVKTLTLEIDANLREATPVKTGHARASWVPSIGAESDVVLEPKANDSQAHDAGVAAVLKFQLADQATFVTNNAPYIQLLNDGRSQQAPSGFVEAAVDHAVATVQSRFDGLEIDLTQKNSTQPTNIPEGT